MGSPEAPNPTSRQPHQHQGDGGPEGGHGGGPRGRANFQSDAQTPNTSGLGTDDMANPLVTQWLAAQNHVVGRDRHENHADKKGLGADKKSADMRGANPTTDQKIQDDKVNAKADMKAAGGHGHKGADQRDLHADNRLKKLDQKMLDQYGDKLSPDTKAAIGKQMSDLDKTIANSKADLKAAHASLSGDRADFKADRDGTLEQQAAANQAQIAARNADATLKPGYMADNKQVIADTKDLVKDFGYVAITRPHEHKKPAPPADSPK
jgi:hypothetical protein